MIDDNILDEILPIPNIEDEKSKIVEELEQEGFVITNFSNGGIFNMLLMILLQAKIDIITLARGLMNSLFISHSSGVWLDLKAADYSRIRKTAVKTSGILTLKAVGSHSTFKIPKGTVFKTNKDINGEELRYFSTDAAVLLNTEEELQVSIEAEKAGSAYNVSQNQIVNSIAFLQGVTDIYNTADWITREGADEETDEALRQRTLNAWADLSKRPIAQAYRNVCETVEGVLYVTVDDMHPRGQGTVDIIVTSTAGEATEALLNRVREAAESIKGEYDNLLVKSSEVVRQDVGLTIILPRLSSMEGIKEQAEQIIKDYFAISTARELHQFIRLDIIYLLKKGIPFIKNIRYTSPTDDVLLNTGTVIILGDLEVNVQWED